MNLVKSQIPSGYCVRVSFRMLEICLATIGVCVFRCVDFGWRIFYCKRRLFMNDNNNLVRFLLTLFLGWIGSIIINHTSLKPDGFTSRSVAYFFLSLVTFGIYGLVASICNLTFDPAKSRNIGYIKD